jgi:hypothetical protein
MFSLWYGLRAKLECWRQCDAEDTAWPVLAAAMVDWSLIYRGFAALESMPACAARNLAADVF